MIKQYLWWGLSLLLVSCAHMSDPIKDPAPKTAREHRNSTFGKLFGDLKIFPFGKSTAPTIGVNAYLWRASLDALSFMPLLSVDPFGGVIITDWYSSLKSPKERYKVNVLIMGRQLRSNALQIKIFRQILQKDQWVESPVKPESIQDLEDAIFKRARYIRKQQQLQ